jgi:hypothetical protein
LTVDRSHALDHVVLVLFENRSLDNLLGHLYGPEDGKTFEGVIGKDLSNPIPEWAEHGAERKTVPYTVATDMSADGGETAQIVPEGRSPRRSRRLSHARQAGARPRADGVLEPSNSQAPPTAA